MTSTIISSIVLFLGVSILLVVILLVAKKYLVPSGKATITINNDKQIEVETGSSLLSTLSNEKIFLPSACGGGGSCAQCRCQVLEGGGEILPTEQVHFSRKQQLNHWRLGCQVKVKNDMKIIVPESVLGVKEWECEVISNKNVATFIKEFIVALPPGEHMNFIPGSYAQIKIPAYTMDYDKDIDKSLIGDEYLPSWEKFGLFGLKCKNTEPTIRAYSMANYPAEGDRIMLTVRIATPPFKPKPQVGFQDVMPGIASSYIFTLKPGDKVIMSGPYGDFHPIFDSKNEMMWIGGGAGMAPLRSQIMHMTKTLHTTDRKMSYFYGARALNEVFYLQDFLDLEKEFPNFSFQDAPFNLKYYKEGHPETEIAYMGCRTRVMANVHDPEKEITPGRGNLSFTSINLPRIAIMANKNIDWFFNELDHKTDLVVEQLLERFEIQAKKKVHNYPFLMGEGIWIDSDKLGCNDEVREVLKNGTLSVGFIGLAEALKALIGVHHGESEVAQNLGLDIIIHMRNRLDALSQKTKLNFTLLATPAEGLSGRFVEIDRKRFGSIEGVTDREYYTNSFHIPVYYHISAYKKIQLEAPYHALTNAGHITYVELDGDPSTNLDAFEKIIRYMKAQGIGYGSINHPVDRDPICGYNGIIGDTCPKCGRKEDEGEVGFQRIRRITGYLVGTLDRFNNAKRAEVRDRVKHSVVTEVKLTPKED